MNKQRSNFKNVLAGITFLAIGILCQPLAWADTELEFASFQSASGNLAPFFQTSDSERLGVVTLKISGERLMIKTAAEDYLIDFELKKLVYRGPSSETHLDKPDEMVIGERIFSFDDIRSRGLPPAIKFLEVYNPFLKKKTAKPKYHRQFEVGKTTKWRKNIRSGELKEVVEFWTLEHQNEERKLLMTINRLIEECGVIVKVKGFGDWLQVFYETQKLPVIVHKQSIFHMPFGIGSNSQEEYFVLRKVQGRALIDERTFNEIAEWKSLWEKIGAQWESWAEKTGWMRPVLIALFMLLLLFTPSWEPKLMELLRGKSVKSQVNKTMAKEQIMRFFNYLSYLKSSLQGQDLAFDPSFSLESFETGMVYKKFFTKKDKEVFAQIKEWSLNKKQKKAMALSPEVEEVLDLFMKRCDSILEKTLSK